MLFPVHLEIIRVFAITSRQPGLFTIAQNNIHRANIGATPGNDTGALVECRQLVAPVETSNVIVNLFRADAPLRFDAYTAQFAVEYEYRFTVAEWHIVFDDDTLVAKRTARMYQ